MKSLPGVRGGEKERRGAKEIRKLGFMAPLQNHQG